jgi:hypothetical protein
LVDSAILEAFLRLSRSGRRWEAGSAQAALDLLGSAGRGARVEPELTRLRSRLRRMTAADVAHRLGSSANWYRYRSVEHTRDQVAAKVRLTGPSLLADPALAAQLGLLPGASDNVYGVVHDLSTAEAELGLILDGEGDIFLTERSSDGGAAEALVDLYLFGNARESTAAAAELARRAAAC